MRLLQYNDNGEFSLTQFFDNIPQYAILSHTWGQEEVTFKDIIEGNRASKTGFDKIRFCGEQARRDRLQYFWVDTCCIDKSSSAELTEAINSMFRWYQKATRCYVYLSDVSTRKRKASDTSTGYTTWESAFRASKWFTRGWTLQELLAPITVEFFSREGKQLGDKGTLKQHIQEITGITILALEGVPLSQFRIDERFSWAKERQTTREEDKAYSLFGIFNIQIPVLYGEGGKKALERLREEINKPLKDKAFKRLCEEGDISLKELDRLPSAIGAAFNSFDRQQDPTCLPDTRVDLLQEIYDWADGEDVRCIFWLNGLAGTGKSTIAQTIAQRYYKEKRLGASFFFSRGGGDVSHAGKFFTSIAVQLAYAVPSLQTNIRDAVRERSDIASLSLLDQWRQLVLGPLSRLEKSHQSYVLVVDALDECEGDNNVGIILELLAEARSLKTVRLRVFLTSRPEIPIRHGIQRIPQAEHQDFILQDIPSATVNHDISLFLEYNLGTIRQKWSLGAHWPSEVALRQLVHKSSGLFIWAATACRFINEGEEFAGDRLDEILEGTGFERTPEQHLDQIYLTILQRSIPNTFRPPEKVRLSVRQQRILGSIAILLSPLPAASLAKIISISGTQVTQTLERLQAILDVSKDVAGFLRIHHPSFRDFLLNKDRSGDFFVDEKKAQQILATGCIQLMSQTLKKDICEIQAPGSQASQVESSRIQKHLPPEVQYACLYWVQHLQSSGCQVHDSEEAHRFLQVHLLHWFEALGWIGKTSEGILAILKLEAQISADESPDLYAFVYDAKRFILYNRTVIEQAPLQIYCSPIIFAPESSVVGKCFKKCIPSWIQTKPKVPKNWDAMLLTFEGHTKEVNDVAFSPDNNQLATASWDWTARLWDAATGATVNTFKGHTKQVSAVTFSLDGKQLATASGDNTIKLWDVVAGTILQTLKGHIEGVSAIAFSPDGKQLASASYDTFIRLWDIITGKTLQTLGGHVNGFSAVVFSPNGAQLASDLENSVQLWTPVTGATIRKLSGHTSPVSAVAFSPNGDQLASASWDCTARLWDTATGATLHILKGHSDGVRAVTFSRDGKQLASASRDSTVQLWDTMTGTALQTLEGHESDVRAVAFSPNGKVLASASYNTTVRLWDVAMLRLQDVATDATVETLEGHNSRVLTVLFSPDGKQLASSSSGGTVRLWDTITGTTIQKWECHALYVLFSPDGKQLAIASGKSVQLWDSATGAVLQVLEGFTSWVSAIAFSPEGQQLVAALLDESVCLFDALTGALLQKFESCIKNISAVALSADKKQLALASRDNMVRLLDTATGDTMCMLQGHASVWVSAVAFSPDGKQLASCAYKSVQLWDTVTGAALLTLEVQGLVTTLNFTSDGLYLRTNRGPIHISPLISPDILDHSSTLTDMFVTDQWIGWMENDLFWLPANYRSIITAVHRNTIAIGYRSGEVLFFNFRI